jgi:hypothetical protein
MDYIPVAQDKVKRLALVNMVINLMVLQKAGKLLPR